MRITVDLNRCEGYAQCVLADPQVFRLRGEEMIEYDPAPGPRRRRSVERAARACPVAAITVEPDEEGRPPSTTSGTPVAAGARPGRVVVVGASLAGLRAAEAVRAGGHRGPLTLIGDEPHEPYDRPPLSKQVPAGRMAAGATALPRLVRLAAEERYGTAATGLDLPGQRVLLADGTEVGFDRLVLATGARARRWPTGAGGDLGGVVAVRSRADAEQLAALLAARPQRVLVVGAGLLGGEVASAVREAGLAVTVVERGPAPLGVLGRTSTAAFGPVFADLHRAHGVDLRTGTTVRRLVGGGDGRVRAAELSDGTTVATDVVVTALGARPNTEWLAGSGIAADARGITCDDHGRVLDRAGRPLEHVVAAGDVARWPDHRDEGGSVAVEHWGSAVEQAATAARTLLAGVGDPTAGRPAPGRPPRFWSHQFGVTIKAVGLPHRADAVVVTHGDPAARRFVAVYGRAGRTVAALSVDQGMWLDSGAAAITAGAPFPPPAPVRPGRRDRTTDSHLQQEEPA